MVPSSPISLCVCVERAEGSVEVLKGERGEGRIEIWGGWLGVVAFRPGGGPHSHSLIPLWQTGDVDAVAAVLHLYWSVHEGVLWNQAGGPIL